MSTNQKVLSVKDLKTYIYVNNRCNKALDGVCRRCPGGRLWHQRTSIDLELGGRVLLRPSGGTCVGAKTLGKSDHAEARQEAPAQS